MKTLRGFLVITLSALAVLALLALLQPARSVSAIRMAAALDVVINEVAWSGTISSTADEWIELKNNTTSTIDLDGWVLRAADGTPTILITGTIAPNGYYLLERTDDTTVSDVPADQFFSGGIGDTGEIFTLTDVLSNVIDTANGDGSAWPAGTGSPNRYSMERIESLAADADLNWASNDGLTRNGHDVGGNPINGTPRQPNSAKPYIPTAPGSVLISAVHADGYVTGQSDEGFRLTNVSTQTITLTNWIATDGQGEGTVNLTGTFAPAHSIWLARYAVTFTQQFGFKPAYEYGGNTDPAVPDLSGSLIDLVATNDELAIREGANNWIDAVVFGTGEITDTGWLNGWSGSNVQRYSNGSIAATGQFLYRKLDEATGQIISDTNTALDWANDRTDPISGRKTQYPGWDLEQFWQTAKVTGTATLTVAIAPDNAYRVISAVLGSAQRSIVMEMHTFDNLGLLDVVTKTIARGVSVTILLEGGPVGGIDNQEKWVCRDIEAAGGQCWFMTNTSGQDIFDRYDYLHAKLIIVDDRVVAIGSENLSPRSLTYDDPADGTRGHRGVYLVTDASGVVSRALEIWQADFDPINQRDIVRWTAALTPPIGFTPNYSIEVGGYRIRYPAPLAVTAPLTFELLTAPESALRASDSLLGLINRSGAGDSIDVEQLDEPPHWGDSASNPIADPNLRLEALIAAAGRGAKVRLLLDRYFDDSASPTSNSATVQYIESLRANSSTLQANLAARLGDPAQFGLHNKMFLFNIGGNKFVHAGSLNGTETSNKANREVALQVQSSAAYDYLRNMFDYDWAFQPRVLLPLVMRDHIAPPNHLLISKVYYLGSTSAVTGSEWVQLFNPTPITVSLSGYKLGDQAAPGSTGFTVDGMWQFPPTAIITPGARINVATTADGFHTKYGRYPDYVFFGAGTPLIPYLSYTPNISFSLANTGDQVLLLGSSDQVVDGVAWGNEALPGNVSCAAIDPNQYPLGNPYISRSPLWKDTDNCPADFAIDTSAQP
jgi:phosphatidylserine/phosphatidylglycerophosphate/cardiolipin synthase-like enzyme